MSVAVAPMQVLNSVVKLMPFLGYVLGGGVYAVPVGVRGNDLKSRRSSRWRRRQWPAAIARHARANPEDSFQPAQALIPPAMQPNAAGTPPVRARKPTAGSQP